jgi:hypothetical protein
MSQIRLGGLDDRERTEKDLGNEYATALEPRLDAARFWKSQSRGGAAMANTVERVVVERDGHWSSRSISILAALAVDVGLVWLLFFRANYNPPVGEAEMFWVRVLAAFGVYAVLQQWTLANQTGRGDDLSAALDKFVAASPLVVAAVIEAYWLGAEGLSALSWRHHAVAALWSAFAVTDFFATDITNQRLRARQFNVGDSGT